MNYLAEVERLSKENRELRAECAKARQAVSDERARCQAAYKGQAEQAETLAKDDHTVVREKLEDIRQFLNRSSLKEKDWRFYYWVKDFCANVINGSTPEGT